ncbi:CaiB/BaiF CoA transferase family protein [Allopusillimonas ginsengisoli]|uniref:CaiB/BaiF CoA transferase family protein n=1 Tax=Allopusillimonas ginsengisoli TaxID=453575 RepID=UPI0010221EF3|nr:CoA transferase [Allopusillimonas ginsengisoli]TEA78758.1 CoA transferase [Allopusillimonas ginsengisoli]
MREETKGIAGVAREQLPLAGIRIIDCTHAMAGPYATSLMGDLGAEVIKVEAPGGDFLRKMDQKFAPGESIYFHSINRSKRSIAIDLKRSAGHQVLESLLCDADIFITNLRVAAVQKLRLDYESIAKIRPEIVYCSVTAFGETGPRSLEPGLDLLGQAVSGIMAMTGEHAGPPLKAGPSITDIVTSFLLCFSAITALRARDRDGVGQKVELNLADSGFATMPNLVTEYMHTHVPMRPWGSGHPQAVPYQAFLAEDGYFVLACLSDDIWKKIGEAIDDPVTRDPRYTRNTARIDYRVELVDGLQRLFASAPREHWMTPLRRLGVPCAPVNTLEEAIVDPQFDHNGMLRCMQHPEFGRYTVVDNPIKMDRTPAAPFGYAPAIGEHSKEILLEAGFSSNHIEELLSTGIITDRSRT